MTTEEGNEIIWQYMHIGVVDDRPEAILPPYDMDWNWLMAVVKKIMKDVSVESEVRTPYIREMIRQDILSALMDLEIGSVYEAVVDAINAINQHANGKNN